MISKTTVILLVALSATCGAHKFRFGTCKNVPGMENFDKTQYYGKWYIIQIFGAINTCQELEFSEKNADEITVNQYRRIVPLEAVGFDHTTTYSGTIMNGKTDKPSELLVKWPISRFAFDMSYTIVDTDYTTYALTYECQNVFGFAKRFSGTILSRTRSLTDEQIADITKIATDKGMEVGHFQNVDQSNCATEADGVVNIDTRNVLGVITDEELAALQQNEEAIVELGNQ